VKTAIMQPYFFPYIGYWQLINVVDTFVILDDVNYIKKGYINKNAILISGKPQNIVLEILGASQNKYINEIIHSGNTSKLLKTIQRTYSKAPYFKDVYRLLEKILTNSEKNLAKFLGYQLVYISSYLDLDTNFLYSSEINKNNNLKGQNKLIEISTKLETEQYINAIGGIELYDKVKFQNENITLNFIKNHLVKYKQFSNDFIPNLSIIDIMMFNNIDDIKIMLNSYELI